MYHMNANLEWRLTFLHYLRSWVSWKLYKTIGTIDNGIAVHLCVPQNEVWIWNECKIIFMKEALHIENNFIWISRGSKENIIKLNMTQMRRIENFNQLWGLLLRKKLNFLLNLFNFNALMMFYVCNENKSSMVENF